MRIFVTLITVCCNCTHLHNNLSKMFLLQVCFDLTILLVAYLITGRILIPKILKPLGLYLKQVIAKDVIEVEDNHSQNKELIDNETYVPKVTQQFSNEFYSLAVVTPSNFTPFTASPTLVNMYLDNCEGLRWRTGDTFNTPTPIMKKGLSKTSGIMESNFLSSVNDIFKYLDDGDVDSVLIDEGDIGSPSFISSPGCVSRFLDDIEEERLTLDDENDKSSQAFLSSPGDIFKYLDNSEEDRIGSITKCDITAFKLPQRRTLWIKD